MGHNQGTFAYKSCWNDALHIFNTADWNSPVTHLEIAKLEQILRPVKDKIQLNVTREAGIILQPLTCEVS